MNKPKTNQKETPNEVQGRDLFKTPNYATKLLLPFIPWNIKYIWECAAGEGKIADVLENHGYAVTRTDIRDCNGKNTILNFLTTDSRIPYNNVTIITNPPFSLKKRFYEKCLSYNIPFALLIPADYSRWLCEAVYKYGCKKIIPTRRIDYITPTGLSGATGHTSYYHSMWLTKGFDIASETECFIELTIEDKKNI